jgi:ABC-2 type transport system ATP-binding protein
MRTEVPVVLDGLTKWFHRTPALDAVSPEIEPGEDFGYLGPNGAGKTATMRMLVGMLRPTAGSARVYGLDTWREAVSI